MWGLPHVEEGEEAEFISQLSSSRMSAWRLGIEYSIYPRGFGLELDCNYLVIFLGFTFFTSWEIENAMGRK